MEIGSLKAMINSISWESKHCLQFIHFAFNKDILQLNDHHIIILEEDAH